MHTVQKKDFIKKKRATPKKKKLLFASKNLNVGGMEKALLTLLSAIDKQSFDVTLVLEKSEGHLLSQLDAQVKLIEYKVSDIKFAPVRKAINFLRRTVFKIRHGGKYDFSCCYATYSTPCEKIAKMASRNSALYVHSDYVGMYSGDFEKAKEFYDYIGIAGYKKVFFVSESGRSGALKIYPELEDRFMTLGNLVDAESIIRLSEEKADLPDCGEKKVFVFVGRLDDTSKKLKRLFEAVSVASSKRNDFDLWIIGEGPDGEMYREYANKLNVTSNVHFWGNMSNPYPYIKKADCLILSSDYEGFPVVYTEAAVLGKSIVTTVPTSDGFLSIGSENAYISEKTPISLAEKMLEFLDATVKKIPLSDFANSNSEKLKILYRNVDN